jgi:predicted ArsR family transcriptional regulator
MSKPTRQELLNLLNSYGSAQNVATRLQTTKPTVRGWMVKYDIKTLRIYE